MNKFQKAIHDRKNKFQLLCRTPLARLSRRLRVRNSVEESTYLGTSLAMNCDFIRRKIVSKNFLGAVVRARYLYLGIVREGSHPIYYELGLSALYQYGDQLPSRSYLEEMLRQAIALKNSELARATHDRKDFR